MNINDKWIGLRLLHSGFSVCYYLNGSTSPRTSVRKDDAVRELNQLKGLIINNEKQCRQFLITPRLQILNVGYVTVENVLFL